jgi:hypothetical protein
MIRLVHLLVCNTQWIFKMRGATIKMIIDEIDLMCVGFRAWDSSIGAVTGLCWTTHESWFDSHQRQEIFLSSKASRPTMETTQPPSQCLLEEISPRIQWLFCEADHSSPSRPMLRMRGAVPPNSICLTCFHRSNFNLSSCKGFKLKVYFTRSSRFNRGH